MKPIAYFAKERDAALAREAALREAAEAVLREQGSNAPVKQAYVALRAALASSPPAVPRALDPSVVELPRDCPDCGTPPGWIHRPGCDVERCSYCGGQRRSCGHLEHDPRQSFWTGYWPGDETCRLLEIDHNQLAEVVIDWKARRR